MSQYTRSTQKVFLIGPASVGKTTIGNLLAKRLGYTFLDVDESFCSKLGNIGSYIKMKGYDQYCKANAEITKTLSRDTQEPTIFATSSGFLAHTHLPEVIKENTQTLRAGFSILLLPSSNPIQNVDMIVERQLARWDNLNERKERQKFLERFDLYSQYGDLKILTDKKPEEVVKEIIENKIFSQAVLHSQ